MAGVRFSFWHVWPKPIQTLRPSGSRKVRAVRRAKGWATQLRHARPHLAGGRMLGIVVFGRNTRSYVPRCAACHCRRGGVRLQSGRS